jgi:3-hydroxyisobutyrate dehydrogenase-like beta-hydroxyacid dehydrogenase
MEISLLGTGLLGAAIGERLLACGHRLTVWNRTPKRCMPLLALHMVQQAGVEVEAFMGILRNSALYAPTFDKKLAKELADDYSNPNFPTAHLRKDLQLFLDAAAALQLETKGLQGLAELLAEATAAGLDELDYSSLHRLLISSPSTKA